MNKTKKYLKEYETLTGKIERCRERIEQIEASLQRSVELDGMPRGTRTGNPTQDTAIKLASIKARLILITMDAELTKQTIADEIERMETPTYKELLYSRYIKLMTWEEVTDRVSIGRKERYDSKHVSGYMHDRALREFERSNDDSKRNS